MNFMRNRFLRFDCFSSERSLSSEHDCFSKYGSSLRKIIAIVRSVSKSIQRGVEKGSEGIKSLQMFLDNHLRSDWLTKILDPQGSFLQKWNYMLAIFCMVALLFDTLFFYIPVIDNKKRCLDSDNSLAIAACVLRSFADIIYMLHILIQFRTGFTAPSSAVYGRGRLIEDSYAIAKRYLSSYFIVDFLSVLPIPQVATMLILPQRKGPIPPITKDWLTYALSLQFFPRLFRIYPLYKEMAKTSGIFVKTAWGGAALNLISYMLASQGIGAFWYFFSIEQKGSCLLAACERQSCTYEFSYCGENHRGNYASLDELCPLLQPNEIINSTDFDFGIFLDALQSRIVETRVVPKKIIYCFWWGFRSLSSLGQNLRTSTYEWEILFAVFISTVGLLLFAFLIGNMQKYLESLTVRIEEMRVKRRDAEQWMSHRMLPKDLRERIRRHEQYRWQETRGVEEESLIQNLPKDIRRDVNRHLCLALVRRVPLFEKMDDQLLDAICDSVKPVLYTANSYLVREADPVNEMLFIVRGNLFTVTTTGGRTGFFNSYYLREGDFCGEELLTWALDPRSSFSLPISNRTITTVTDVVAFALMAADLKLVASQFRRLHSKEVRHTFRFYSRQWRMWAACFIQAAWRRHYRKKLEKSLREEEEGLDDVLAKSGGVSSNLGATIYASKLAANALRVLRRNRAHDTNLSQLLQRPAEPVFTADYS